LGIVLGRYRAVSRRSYARKLGRQRTLQRWAFPEGVTSKVRRVLQHHNAEFKGREECGVCGEETLLVFEDFTGTYTTCANPKCVAHGDLNYYPKAGGQ